VKDYEPEENNHLRESGMRSVWGITLIVFLAVSTASLNEQQVTAGNVYYVATNGNNSNPGTFSQPWRTIYKATTSIHAGDTVYLRGGTYNESNEFRINGTESAPITIAGYPNEVAIINGNGYTIPARESGQALIQVYGDWYVVRDLTVTGSGDQGITTHGVHDIIHNVYSHHNWGWGIFMNGNYDLAQNSRAWSNSMMNEHNQLESNWSGGITCARYPDYCTIRNNRSWENWGEGISTFEALHSTIMGNTTYDNKTNIYISDTKYALVQGNLNYCSPGNLIDPYNGPQNGILVYDERGVPIPLNENGDRYPSSDNIFLNNIIRGCDNNLFATANQAANNLYFYNTFVNSDTVSPGYAANVQFVVGHATGQRFVNNLVYQSDTIAILQVDDPDVISFSNNLWSKDPPAYFHARGTGDVIGDPKFSMIGSFRHPAWYTLTSVSPAINKGLGDPKTNVEFFGTLRDSQPDMGALEYGINTFKFIFLPIILRGFNP
jgi:hypothetical protein